MPHPPMPRTAAAYRPTTAEQVVRALAAEPYPEHREGGCSFCAADGDPGEHTAWCPWRMAREWVALADTTGRG
jgi:hypothetical protein